jgi:long-chain fatty acid transport protein
MGVEFLYTVLGRRTGATGSVASLFLIGYTFGEIAVHPLRWFILNRLTKPQFTGGTLKRSTLRLASLVILLLVTGVVAFSGGYQLNEHGARATAMAGAFAARASDPSAIFFNPAGLAFQSGNHLMVGGTLILPSTKFTSQGSTPSETKGEPLAFFPPNVYGTYAVTPDLVVGLGVYTPYGLGTEWNKDWVGKYAAVKTDLKTFYFNPTVSYKLSDELAIGVGMSYIYGSVALSRRVPTYGALVTVAPGIVAPNPATASVGTVNLDATASGFGFNAGVIYKPMKGLSFGFSYRSETKLEFKGTAKFTDMLAFAPYFPGGDGKATLPMPSNMFLGVAYDVMTDLTVEVDFQLVGWSAYDKLTLDMPVGPPISFPPSLGGTRPLQGPSTDQKKWDNGYLGRIGLEYRYSDELTLRAGGIMDISPQPPSKAEPMLPDADRIDLALGAGYKLSQDLTIDFSYLIVLFAERKTVNPVLPGTYNSVAHLFGVNFGYAF